MPDRILRAGILSSDPVNELNWGAEVFYRRLFSVADDYGRFDGRLSMLRSQLYPLKVDRVSEADVGKWLTDCVTAGLVSQYQVSGRPYVEVQKFGQRIQSKSKYPDPVNGSEVPCNTGIDGKEQESTVGHGGSQESTALFGVVFVEDQEQKIFSSSVPDDPPVQNGLVGMEPPPVDPTQPPPPDPEDKRARQAAAKAERLKAVTGYAIDAYNRILAKPEGELPAVQIQTEKRESQVKRCLKTASLIATRIHGDPRLTPEFWGEFFDSVAQDDFHSGRKSGGKGHEGWTPDFEFLTRPDVMEKIFDKAMSS